MSTGDRHPSPELHPDDDAPDALDRLLAQLRVPVRPEFSRGVMVRVAALPQPERASSSRLWVAAAVAAAVLALAAAVVVAGGASGTGSPLHGVVDLVVATLAAGGGLAAASWRGLGHAVGAALDGSVTAILALGLAAVCANALLFVLLRRRRASARGVDRRS